MIAVVFHNFEHNPALASGGSFDDVTNDTWYVDGILWAASRVSSVDMEMVHSE